MKAQNPILEAARRTIEIEAAAIQQLSQQLTDDFGQVIEKIATGNGRVVISGIGKSAIVAQKIVATLNSTGSPSLFLHAADAIHGDLGVVQPEDTVIIISKSGESPEIRVLVPLIKSLGNLLVAMTGNPASYLAGRADLVLHTAVEKEACPNNLAPTSSTTAQMVMGDALAVCLMEKKGFQSKDFARLHPGGNLGKRLYLRVADLYQAHQKPEVPGDGSVKQVIMEITRKRLGVTGVTGADGHLIGIITDGDLRRMLEKTDDIRTVTARDIMTQNPKSVTPDTLAVQALEMMRSNEITQLVVMEGDNYLGIVHLHDIIKEGLI